MIYAINILIYRVIEKDKSPRFFDYYIFEVKSGSMENTIHINDYIIVKKTNDIKLNDIVTYKKDNYYITHRVIDIDGNKVITKGDANNLQDDEINRKDIIGKYICKSDFLKILIKYKIIIIGFIILIYIFSLLVDSDEEEKRRNICSLEKKLKG